MSITTETNRNDYVGNNATATYSYTFKILDASDLRVTVRDDLGVETTLALNTDYTVTGVRNKTGGNITLTAGNLTSGHALTLRRVRPITQESDIRNQGDFHAQTHEDAFDHLTMVDQQQQDEINRSIKLAETDYSSGMTLPVASERAGRYLAFDVSGNPIASSAAATIAVTPFIETLVDDTTAAQARATLGFSGAGGTVAAANIDAGAVGRTALAVGGVARNTQTTIRTSAYTVTTSDDVIRVSGASAAFNVTLPTAASVQGRRYKIIRTDSTIANAITIATTSSQTINGATTRRLHSQYEMMEVESDGANWLITNRFIPSVTAVHSSTFTSLVTGTTTNPTFGTTPVNRVLTQRLGASCRFNYECRYTSAGTAGSGDYLFALPAGHTFDSSFVTYYTTVEGTGNWSIGGASVLGNAAGDYQGITEFIGVVIPYDSTRFRVAFIFTDGTTPSGGFASSSAYAPVGTSGSYSFSFIAPMTNWEG